MNTISKVLIAAAFSLLLTGCGDMEQESSEETSQMLNIIETSVYEPYTQNYPVTDFQSIYAKFLQGMKSYNSDEGCMELPESYIIHIDEDIVPELMIYEDYSTLSIYSINDAGQVCWNGRYCLGGYKSGFCYRPYQSMLACSRGSLMNNTEHMSVTLIEKHDGALSIGETYRMGGLNRGESYRVDERTIFVGNLEETLKYDFYYGCMGESWISTDDMEQITPEQVDYWIENSNKSS